MKTKQYHRTQQNTKLSTLDPERGSFQKNPECLCLCKSFQKGFCVRPGRTMRLAEADEERHHCLLRGLLNINSLHMKLVEESLQSCSFSPISLLPLQQLIRALKCISIQKKQRRPQILLLGPSSEQTAPPWRPSPSLVTSVSRLWVRVSGRPTGRVSCVAMGC